MKSIQSDCHLADSNNNQSNDLNIRILHFIYFQKDEAPFILVFTY